jgi:hypothetical protein
MLALVLAALLAQPAPETPPPAPPAPAGHARPQVPPAPARAAHTPALPPGGLLRGEWPSQPSGKRITLEKTISIDDALEAIADAADWNAVLNTHRTGGRLLVLKLRDVPVEDALQAAIQGTELVATRRGNTVVVAPAIEPVEQPPVLSGFDRPSGKKFTGDFADVGAGEALRKIAKAAGLSIVLPSGDLEQVNASFQGVPVEDALRAVLEQAGLAGERQGTLLLVTERPRGFSFKLGQFGLKGKLPPEVSREVEQAMRNADREMQRADREMRRADRHAGNHDRDRVVHGDVVVHQGERVDNVVAIRGSVKLESGSEAKDVVAILGNVTLDSGSRAERATAILGDVKVGPGAQVEEEATAVLGRVQADPSADVGKETSVGRGIPSIPSFVGPWGGSPLLAVAQALAQFAIYFALGLLIVALFPRRVDAVAASMVAHPVKAVLVGLLGTVAIPVLTVLLVVTVVGILLVPVQALAVIIAGILGFTALSFHIGRSLPIHLERGTWVLQLAVGTAIVVVLTQIPVLGWLAFLSGWLLVFGAVLRSRFGGQGPVLPTTAVAQPPAPPPPAPA